MGLLNHLFGNKKTLGKEVLTDEKKKNRINIFERYIVSFEEKEELAKQFSFKNINSTLQNPELFTQTLNQIEALITEELIEAKNEEKLDHEILSDLKRINSDKGQAEITNLTSQIVYGRQKQTAIIELLRRIHAVLTLELHTIKLMRKKPANLKDIALHFFELIFFREAVLVKVLRAESFHEENAATHRVIWDIAQAVILEEELKEEIISDEEKFVDEMVKKMGFEDSRNHHRRLGETIYLDLVQLTGAPFTDGEAVMKGIEALKKLIQDEQLLYQIIKKNRPKYTDAKIRVAVMAFKKAYDLGHFVDLEETFLTKP